jgi:hypothetical protein
MADPEIAKRNARRNYKTTANEEFDESDERKKYDQSLPYRGAGERNAKGDTWSQWMFEDINQRALKGQVDANEARSSRENAQGGYYGQAPKFNKGGAVKHGSSTTVACSNNKIVR